MSVVNLSRMPNSELQELKEAIDFLEQKMKDKMYDKHDLVEVCSRLTVLTSKLTDIKDEMRAQLKTKMLEEGITVLDGKRTAVAQLTEIVKECLDIPRVRNFLGSQLPKFLIMRTEHQLKFGPRA